MSNHSIVKLLAELPPELIGKVICPCDDPYEDARRVWNGAIDRHPAYIVRCENAVDVQAAVNAAQTYALPISVRGGGYDWAGRSMRQNGLVIDLSAMNNVTIDAQAQIATIEGGTTGADLADAAAHHGLMVVTGANGKIGMAGFTLGGGYGPLSPKYGLGADNLLGADVVLADGRCVRVNAEENPDLFWALRGGGGNFGVVIAMTIRLHLSREVLAGKLVFGWPDARDVLAGFNRIMAFAPDELALTAAIVSLPGGRPAIALAPCWCGDLAQGLEVIAGLRDLGTPMADTIEVMPPTALFDLFEPSAPPGRYYAQQTRWLRDLGPAPITDLVVIGEAKTSPLSMVAVQSFHGAPSRIPLALTAFGLRARHILVSIVAAWKASPANSGDAHRRWAEDASSRLAPHAFPGGYPNLLGPNERAQADAAFGANTHRLLAEKQNTDPGNIFTATSLPSAPGFAPKSDRHDHTNQNK